MLAFPANFKIYLALAPVDMRRHFNGLWSVAEQTLRIDPRQGAILVFINKKRDRIKILYWDGTGVCILAKRLEKGVFFWPAQGEDGRSSVAPEALTMLLAGIDLRRTAQRAWYGRGTTPRT